MIERKETMKPQQAASLTHPLITAEHLSRKAIVYLRQSSQEQVQRNTGSQAFQRNQVDIARAYGWSDDRIELIDEDLGKSGSTLDRRTGWVKDAACWGFMVSFRSIVLDSALHGCRSFLFPNGAHAAAVTLYYSLGRLRGCPDTVASRDPMRASSIARTGSSAESIAKHLLRIPLPRRLR